MRDLQQRKTAARDSLRDHCKGILAANLSPEKLAELADMPGKCRKTVTRRSSSRLYRVSKKDQQPLETGGE